MANYTGDAVYAISHAVSNDFRNILGRTAPLLAAVLAGNGFNRDSVVQGDGYFRTPVITANTGMTFGGVTKANQLTNLTLALHAGTDHAKYHVAHLRVGYVITADERKRLNSGDGRAMANVVDAKQNQLQTTIKTTLGPIISGSAADAEDAPMGMLRPLAIANTVGGINQATETNWQSNVDSTGGVLALNRLDRMIRLANNREGDIDLMVFSEGSGGGANMYEAFLGLIRGKETIVNNNGKTANFGFKAAMYAGIECIGDQYITGATGKVAGFSSKQWHVVGDSSPNFMEASPYNQTDALQVIGTMYLGTGTEHPGGSFLISTLAG